MALLYQYLNLLNLNGGETKTLENIIAFTIYADGGDCILTTSTSGNNTITIPQGTGFSAQSTSSNLYKDVTITCVSGNARLVWVG
jgi:hypothetical protein